MREIHQALKDEFKRLTGKENYKIYKSVYFIPLYPVFEKRLKAACSEYGMDDMERIKEVLLNYLRDKVKSNFPKYTRSIQYYIYGQNGKDCMLADDYFNVDILKEEDLNKKPSNKDLFG